MKSKIIISHLSITPYPVPRRRYLQHRMNSRYCMPYREQRLLWRAQPERSLDAHRDTFAADHEVHERLRHERTTKRTVLGGLLDVAKRHGRKMVVTASSIAALFAVAAERNTASADELAAAMSAPSDAQTMRFLTGASGNYDTIKWDTLGDRYVAAVQNKDDGDWQKDATSGNIARTPNTKTMADINAPHGETAENTTPAVEAAPKPEALTEYAKSKGQEAQLRTEVGQQVDAKFRDAELINAATTGQLDIVMPKEGEEVSREAFQLQLLKDGTIALVNTQRGHAILLTEVASARVLSAAKSGESLKGLTEQDIDLATKNTKSLGGRLANVVSNTWITPNVMATVVSATVAGVREVGKALDIDMRLPPAVRKALKDMASFLKVEPSALTSEHYRTAFSTNPEWAYQLTSVMTPAEKQLIQSYQAAGNSAAEKIVFNAFFNRINERESRVGTMSTFTQIDGLIASETAAGHTDSVVQLTTLGTSLTSALEQARGAKITAAKQSGDLATLIRESGRSVSTISASLAPGSKVNLGGGVPSSGENKDVSAAFDVSTTHRNADGSTDHVGVIVGGGQTSDTYLDRTSTASWAAGGIRGGVDVAGTRTSLNAFGVYKDEGKKTDTGAANQEYRAATYAEGRITLGQTLTGGEQSADVRDMRGNTNITTNLDGSVGYGYSTLKGSSAVGGVGLDVGVQTGQYLVSSVGGGVNVDQSPHYSAVVPSARVGMLGDRVNLSATPVGLAANINLNAILDGTTAEIASGLAGSETFLKGLKDNAGNPEKLRAFLEKSLAETGQKPVSEADIARIEQNIADMTKMFDWKNVTPEADNPAVGKTNIAMEAANRTSAIRTAELNRAEAAANPLAHMSDEVKAEMATLLTKEAITAEDIARLSTTTKIALLTGIGKLSDREADGLLAAGADQTGIIAKLSAITKDMQKESRKEVAKARSEVVSYLSQAFPGLTIAVNQNEGATFTVTVTFAGNVNPASLTPANFSETLGGGFGPANSTLNSITVTNNQAAFSFTTVNNGGNSSGATSTWRWSNVAAPTGITGSPNNTNWIQWVYN